MPQKIPQRRYRNVVLRSKNAVVHLEYKPQHLPPKPTEGIWTRFVCISDTHTKSFDVPDGDVLLHGGDLTNLGTVPEFERTTEWLYSLPHRFKIIIAGNHDLTLHRSWYEDNFSKFHRKGKQEIDRIYQLLKGPRAVEGNIVYLQDEAYNFKVHEHGREWSAYGFPWSPRYCHWAFNYEREDGEALMANIPRTDILLTHTPAYKIFDQERHGSEVGCEALRARLPFLRPKLHLCGHIHEAHGAYIHPWLKDSTSGLAEPPAAQNSESQSAVDAKDEPQSSEYELHEGFDEEVDYTVFVNGANYPMGHLASRDGVHMNQSGGPGFQPIIIDLKE